MLSIRRVQAGPEEGLSEQPSDKEVPCLSCFVFGSYSVSKMAALKVFK